MQESTFQPTASICRHFQLGRCRWQNQCRFMHMGPSDITTTTIESTEDLKTASGKKDAVVVNEVMIKKNRQPCIYHLTAQECPFQDFCTYEHDERACLKPDVSSEGPIRDEAKLRSCWMLVDNLICQSSK